MSGGKPAQATEVKQTQLPAWVEGASKENYDLAKSIAGTSYQPYQGPTVAGQSPYTTQGYNLAQSTIGSTDPYYTEAGGAYRSAGDIYKATSGPLDINPYLNPYTQEVENRAVANAERSLTSNLLDVNDLSRTAGAFGGSRHGIESGVTRAEGVRNIGDLTAELRRAGIDYATTTALNDRTGIRSSAAGLLGVGSGLLSTASGKEAAEAQDINQLYAAGAQDRNYFQQLLDAEAKKFYEMRDYPTEQLNIRLAALGMSPYGRTETGSKTSTQEQLPTDWATLGLGGAKIAASMYSDRNMKTDIEKLTGGPIPMYAYRYKSDPKSYPKVVGPMAQDIEKIAPKAVKKVGGKRVVNLSNLMEVLS